MLIKFVAGPVAHLLGCCSLFRMVAMPAPVTCLSFSAEGAAVYAGTENGKFLLLDLRALDKPPKSITVSDNGDQVVALSVQVCATPMTATHLVTMRSVEEAQARRGPDQDSNLDYNYHFKTTSATRR